MPGLQQVEVVQFGSRLQALLVLAPATHDWDATAAAVAAQSWWFDREPFDLVTALRSLAVRAPVEGPAADAAQAADWELVGATDPRMRAERILLRAIEQRIAARRELWDPRLDEVAAIAEAWRSVWRSAAPGLPDAPDEVKPELPLRLQVDAALAAPIPDGVAAATANARSRLSIPVWRASTVARAWQRVAAVSAEAADHAERVAARTKDAMRAAAYRRFAAQCRELSDAAAVLGEH